MEQQKLTRKDFVNCFCVVGAIVFAMVMVSDDPSEDLLPTESLNPGYIACQSKSDLEAFVVAPERMQLGMVLDNRCLLTSRLPEHDYTIVDAGFTSHVLVRLADDQYVDLYVPREATLRRYAEVARVTE
jgi:hypothetical protein